MKLWFLVCLSVAGVALGQAPTSCIQDTLTSATATNIQLGTIQISWPQFNYGTSTVAPGQLTYTVNNGLVGGSANPLCLVPTDHSSPSAVYSIRITPGPGTQATQTYWKLPTTGGPFTINQLTISYTPGPNTSINPTQITTTGGAIGYTLTLNSLLVPTWLPGASGTVWGGITGTLSNQTDLESALTAKQNSLGYTPANIASNLSDLANEGTARTNLGVAIGTNVEAWSANLDAWSGKTAPTGTVVGTSDTQTLTGKTLDGVTPTTMGYLDATSSIQTQLNSKQGTLNQTLVDALGYATGGGTANAQTVTLSPAVASLTVGLTVCWLPTAANSTTTPTLLVNGLTPAVTIIKTGGAALASNDLTTTAIACAKYDGTYFELQNAQTASSGGSKTVPNWQTIQLAFNNANFGEALGYSGLNNGGYSPLTGANLTASGSLVSFFYNIGTIPANWTGAIAIDGLYVLGNNNTGTGTIKPMYSVSCLVPGTTSLNNGSGGSYSTGLTFNTPTTTTVTVSSAYIPVADLAVAPALGSCAAGNVLVLAIQRHSGTGGDTASDSAYLLNLRVSLPYTI